jgi:hypothetical protein
VSYFDRLLITGVLLPDDGDVVAETCRRDGNCAAVILCVLCLRMLIL